MTEVQFADYILKSFEKAERSEACGYTFFFFGGDRMMPFTTIANQDSEHDPVSDLKRPGVFRLNVGVGRELYRAMFDGAGSSGTENSPPDYTALDRIMPHPDYAAQYWICVLNPSDLTFEALKPMLARAYELAARRQGRSRTPGTDEKASESEL